MTRVFVVVMVGLGLVCGTLVWDTEALASILCRSVEGHQVCLETIKRSAKYFWEYRVVVTVDGNRQPSKRYDCRQPQALSDETAPPLAESHIQQLICDFVTH